MAKVTPGIVLGLMVAACGGGDPADDLLGTWMEALTPNESSEPLDTITYKADGTWVFGEGGTGNVGQWNVEGDRLFTLTDSRWSPSSDTQFAVDDGRLLMDVMRPNGEVDGVLGGWLGTTHGYGPTDMHEEREHRIGLNADGNGWYSITINGDTGSFVGTWRREGHFVFLDTPRVTFDFIVAPGAIGRQYWERVE